MDTILAPLEWVVSVILVAFHRVFAVVFGFDSGWSWMLAIVGLVVVMRLVLIPLFVKQIKSSRGMALLQPQIKEIQRKYKDDRERQSQEMMRLYKDTGTNPLASCLPILAQAPIFYALFRVLNGIALGHPKGVMTGALVHSAANASIFGAKIADTFLRADGTATRVVTVVLIVLMSATSFLTQRQLMRKNMPPGALEGPFAQQQKILLYVFPFIFAVSGVSFPIGVLIYWLTTNLWSMGQQFYVIRRMPAPGSAAAEALERRQAERARRHADGPVQAPQSAVAGDGGGRRRSLFSSTRTAGPAGVTSGASVSSGPSGATRADLAGRAEPGRRPVERQPGGQRQQPKRRPRDKRQGPGGRQARGPQARTEPTDGPGAAAS